MQRSELVPTSAGVRFLFAVDAATGGKLLKALGREVVIRLAV